MSRSDPISPEDLITISNAAEAKDCSRTTIYRAIGNGRLTGVEVGERKMIVKDETWEDFEPVYTGFRREKYEGDPDASE
jgi:excisionase family DNA binding protein